MLVELEALLLVLLAAAVVLQEQDSTRVELPEEQVDLR